MSEPDCKLCRDERWICEEHPEQPMGHDECMGAGMPCPRAGRATSTTARVQNHRRPQARPPSVKKPRRGAGLRRQLQERRRVRRAFQADPSGLRSISRKTGRGFDPSARQAESIAIIRR